MEIIKAQTKDLELIMDLFKRNVGDGCLPPLLGNKMTHASDFSKIFICAKAMDISLDCVCPRLIGFICGVIRSMLGPSAYLYLRQKLSKHRSIPSPPQTEADVPLSIP
jgi:hypothetical protein